MKRLIIFIIGLVISLPDNLSACGFYLLVGEDARFCALNPYNFGFKNFDYFFYTSERFSYKSEPDYSNNHADIDENVLLWQNRCKNVPSANDIDVAIYGNEDSLHFLTGSNNFVNYLFVHKDKAAIDYIDFAKKCSQYNQVLDDPWERNEEARIPERLFLIQQALHRAEITSDKDIQLRYAFLAIRLAYYNSNTELLNKVYARFFEKSKTKNIIYYWALYFKVRTQPSSALTNYQSALVFLSAPDKRFMVSFQYDRKIPLNQTLAFAKSAKERSAIYLLDGIKNYERGLKDIQSLYENDPHNDDLGFLILREINKLEDWIFTPYYTNYPPSLFDDVAQPVMNRRINRDKVYLNNVLSFIKSIDVRKVGNPILVKTAKAYLLYMSGDYNSCLTEIALLRKMKTNDEKLRNQLNIIQALCATAKQKKYEATITAYTKKQLLEQYRMGNNKFVFAIARELEYKGNTTDAALLLSTLPKGDYPVSSRDVFWTKKRSVAGYDRRYYWEYFAYIDEQYSPSEVESVISEVAKNNNTDSFTVWKTHAIKPYLQSLYDLLGTKYLRLNNLHAALKAYENVTDTFWMSDQNVYKSNLDANPFYTNFYNEHKRTKADTITFTKTTLVKTLSEYLAKAEDVHNKDRDYYYFLVANCYFNMTQYGNSWIMKRYSWSTNGGETLMPDNKEYFHCNYAKQYYLKAKEVSKNKKFAALCLRMAARCEFYKITYNNGNWDGEGKNPYYVQLRKQYPYYYDDLAGNCESFEVYLKARR